MSASGGSKAIVAALLANFGIAVSKFVAFLLTGSSSLLAESAHSLADTGNQGLLLIGGRRAQREATARHPFGYGRDRYFYAFVVALVLFSLGSLFALYEGYEKLHEPHAINAPAIAIGVLVIAILLESFSFRTAIVEANKVRGGRNWVAYVRRATAPELPVVLLEDLAALVGLVFALLGVTLSLLTGDPVWDAVGTLAIGVLLGIVAGVLAVEMKSLLIGEAATPEAVERIRAAIESTPGVNRVIHLRTMHLGPDELLVGAKVEFTPPASLAEVTDTIDAAERRIRGAEPVARVIYLEPDLYRAELSQSAGV